MSNFLNQLPRRLPVALADYVAGTEADEMQRRAVADRIYAALTTEQRAETRRICEAISADVGRGNSVQAEQYPGPP